MSSPLKICSAVAGSILVVMSLAWAGPVPPAQTSHETENAPADTAATIPSPSGAADLPSHGMSIVSEAIKYTGTRYRWGGTSPQYGFDCSGFVQFVFQHALNIRLPRMPVDMSRRGERVNREELAPGDLVFFNTRGGKFTHVGIYVSDSQFIHAPMPGTRVMLTRMDSAYYRHRFTYAVRIQAE